MPPPRDVLAAGAVVFRPGRQVLLVHRPRYDDWAFPKGKLDPGEHRTTAAVREVAEETGLRVRLGVPLADQRYPTGDRMKTVHYWVGRVVGDDDVSGYAVNDEVDAVDWVDLEEAPGRLTYAHDRATLAEAVGVRRRTHPLVVLRHTEALPRKKWSADDRERPLTAAGRDHAARIAPVLGAYDVQRVLTSASTRCLETVAPYVDLSAPRTDRTARLSEQEATPRRVRRVVDGLVEQLAAERRGALLCTHRPVLPLVFEALCVADPGLELGEMLVLHLREGRVLATERHLAP